MPICSKCTREKAFDEFPVDRSRPSGRSPRCKECSRSASKTYDAAHKKQRARYNRKNAEQIAATSKAWREAHPEWNRALHEQWRASVAGAEGIVTVDDWTVILAQYDFRCAYCKEEVDGLTMDHVVPLSKGGKHLPDNIVPACFSCNSSKGAKDVEEWLKSRSGG